MKKLAFLLAVFMSFSALSCDDDGGSGPGPIVDTSYIKILEPKPGAKFKMGEKFKIIAESDYDKFAESLTFSVSPDTGKTWIIVLSLGVKTGMNVRDTVTASFDTLFIDAGTKTQIRVMEYSKKHYKIVDNIEVLPP